MGRGVRNVTIVLCLLLGMSVRTLGYDTASAAMNVPQPNWNNPKDIDRYIHDLEYGKSQKPPPLATHASYTHGVRSRRRTQLGASVAPPDMPSTKLPPFPPSPLERVAVKQTAVAKQAVAPNYEDTRISFSSPPNRPLSGKPAPMLSSFQAPQQQQQRSVEQEQQEQRRLQDPCIPFCDVPHGWTTIPCQSCIFRGLVNGWITRNPLAGSDSVNFAHFASSSCKPYANQPVTDTGALSSIFPYCFLQHIHTSCNMHHSVSNAIEKSAPGTLS